MEEKNGNEVKRKLSRIRNREKNGEGMEEVEEKEEKKEELE